MYIERNKLQLELTRHRKHVYFIYVYFYTHGPLATQVFTTRANILIKIKILRSDGFNAISPTEQEVSNANHFGSVADRLGRVAAASQCMARKINTKGILCGETEKTM